ncbi:tumor necrosis factor receptor superfamily member 13B [Ambystoma mexicanum]|uniref:tumor necrosis factor receptor superfamily member 13B n=1 Tax=Ambystoma mexicanum TaxID=8296 RepID=UPI0037E7D340
MASCSEQEYWDALVNKCMPCRLRCQKSTMKKCSSFCESLKCGKQQGFYYDKLLSDCVSCSDVCGQHPTQCTSFCQASGTGIPESRPGLSQDQTVLMYTLLGLSLFITLCSLLFLLRCFIQSEADHCSCKPPIAEENRNGSSKDRLVIAETGGGGGSGSAGSGTPEPAEACVFCYSEPRPTVEESGRNHCAPHTCLAPPLPSQVASGGCVGSVPIDIGIEDRPFTIICSPTQEKMSMT